MKANPWSPCLILSQKGLSLADKGYASQANRSELNRRGLKDGIMHKAARGCPMTADQQQRNHHIKLKRWVIEQTFGTLKRRFIKAMCLNLLKASNKVSYV